MTSAVMHRCRMGEQGQRSAVGKADLDLVGVNRRAARRLLQWQCAGVGLDVIAENPEIPRPLGCGRSQGRVGVFVEPQQRRRMTVAPNPAGVGVAGEPHPGGHGFEQGFELGRAGAHGLRVLPPQPRHVQIGCDPGEQLAGGKGLGQVVVGAGIHALDPRLFAGACRQQDERHVAQQGIVAHCPQQPEPIELRHHHVAEDQIRPPPPRLVQRRHAIGDGGYLIALGQQPLHVIAHIGVVVGEQHERARR